MPTRTGNNGTLPVRFTAKLQKSSAKGGWTFIIWPESVQFFRTRGLVKIKGEINGHPFASSFMALGNGTHKLPVKEELRKAINKAEGDTVEAMIWVAGPRSARRTWPPLSPQRGGSDPSS